MKKGLLLACALLIAGCGKVGDLQPAPGQTLPVKPLLAERTPTPEELLEIPDVARPERVDGLRRRSEPRTPDRFDLPPPTGDLVPPALDDEDTNAAPVEGPVNPQ